LQTILFRFVFFMMLVFVWGSAEAAPAVSCAGCEKLKTVADKLSTVSLRDEKRIHDVLEAASKAILELPKSNGQRLTRAQVHETVLLLSKVVKLDKLNMVLQDVIEVVKANKVDIDAEVKRLPREDGKLLATSIVFVLAEESEGQDTASPKK